MNKNFKGQNINNEAERAAPELAPCPFCGSATADAMENQTYGGYMVMCNDCTAEGGLRETRAEAIDSWNRRTAAPVAADVALPPLDAELPPLPGRTAFYPDRKAFALGFTSDSMRNYARTAIAPYVERIAVLELIDAIPESGSVPVPTTVDMARMMLALGHSYLKEHAPDQLAAPAAEADKDAARYRWLRDEARSVDWSRPFRLGTTSAYSYNCRQSPNQMDRDIDAAIDARTKAETEKGST